MLFFVVLFFAFIAVICWCFYVWSFKKPTRTSKSIPGPIPLPLLGNILHLNVSNVRLLQLHHKIWWEKYGKIYQFWLGPIPYVALSSPEAIQVILASSKLINKSRDYSFFDEWLGTGLVTSAGSLWRSRRRMLTPAFHFKILEEFVPVMHEKATQLIEILSGQIRAENTALLNIYTYISRCTLDIIAQTAMGLDVKVQADPESKYVRAVTGLTRIVQCRMFRPWLWPKSLFLRTTLGQENRRYLNIVHGYADHVIKDRSESRDLSSVEEIVDSDFIATKQIAFLDLLLTKWRETGELSLVDVRDEGHDTTAVSTCFLLFALATNPEAQEWLYRELDEYFGTSDRLFDVEDAGALPYLECCIKESLRLYSTVPFIARNITEDTTIGNYTLKKGCMAMILIYALHHDPEYFPDPFTFRPERFLPQNFTGHHPFVYIPFSAGPRNCIGQRFASLEEKILISSIVRNFRLETDMVPSDLHLSTEALLRTENPILLRLVPR